MKKIIQEVFAFFGLKISRIQKVTGNAMVNFKDPFSVQKHLFKDSNGELIIFDIGAYIGHVSVEYGNIFPKSTIYSFEPFPDSFAQLIQHTSLYKNIIPINLGIGEYEGISKFQSNAYAPTNSILTTDKKGQDIWGKGLLDTIQTIDINITSIDDFVSSKNIDKIDILKMDVQGAEFMVLQGAKKTLEKGVIKMIYTEIITLPTYEGQLQFDETIKLIRGSGFELFNLYDQNLSNSGQMRVVDAIFIKSK